VAWYDHVDGFTAGIAAVGATLMTLVVGLGNALLKARRALARDNSEIKQEKSDVKAGTWLNEQMMAQILHAEASRERAEMSREEALRMVKEMFEKREASVVLAARLEEQLASLQRSADECADRAQRAETRAAVAEDHMRHQTEQILMMSINIDQLTTELSKYDKETAVRLAPKLKKQALLVGADPEQQDGQGGDKI